MVAPVEVEVLADGRLVVWSNEDSRRLFNIDFYGKPLGNPKPKEDFDEPLILDLIEGVYLAERKEIHVKSGGKRVGLAKLKKLARTKMNGFDTLYRVYNDLRSRGYVVTPGMKYGCDFAVYEQGPGIDHAPYIIQVMDHKEGMSATDIVKAGRLASTVRKTFIVALPEKAGVEYLEFKWWKA